MSKTSQRFALMTALAHSADGCLTWEEACAIANCNLVVNPMLDAGLLENRTECFPFRLCLTAAGVDAYIAEYCKRKDD